MSGILDARKILGVRNETEYLRRHTESMAKLGVDLRAEPIKTQVPARIDHGRWLFDCGECGAGVAAHPDWTASRCFECGAVWTSVAFPPERAAIEHVLLERRTSATRNWKPGETVAELNAENAVRRDLTADEREAIREKASRR